MDTKVNEAIKIIHDILYFVFEENDLFFIILQSKQRLQFILMA